MTLDEKLDALADAAAGLQREIHHLTHNIRELLERVTELEQRMAYLEVSTPRLH